MSNLITEKGDDGNIWMTHLLTGCAIAVCREIDGKWFVAAHDLLDYSADVELLEVYSPSSPETIDV